VAVVDVSSWSSIQPEQGGLDARKEWLSLVGDAPRDEWWLWKPLKETGSLEGTRPTRINDVAEMVAHHLAEAIGLPSAPCKYAVRDGERGIISRQIAPHLYELSPGSAWGAQGGDGYTVDSILSVLEGLTGPPPCEGMSAAEVFTGYLVLDAWIGNTDRHEENWAVIEPPDGTAYLAPTFDHGSALGSGMTNDRRERCDRHAWCARGKSRAFKRPLIDIAREAVDLTGAAWWADRVATVHPATWTAILDEHGALSDLTRSFVSDVLTINQERVSEACRP
jgi:hypothetical protein